MGFKIEFDSTTIILAICIAILFFIGPDMELFTNSRSKANEIQPVQTAPLIASNCSALAPEYAKLSALSKVNCAAPTDGMTSRDANNIRLRCYDTTGYGIDMANNMLACKGAPLEAAALPDAATLEGPHMMLSPIDKMNLAPYEKPVSKTN